MEVAHSRHEQEPEVGIVFAHSHQLLLMIFIRVEIVEISSLEEEVHC